MKFISIRAYALPCPSVHPATAEACSSLVRAIDRPDRLSNLSCIDCIVCRCDTMTRNWGSSWSPDVVVMSDYCPYKSICIIHAWFRTKDWCDRIDTTMCMLCVWYHPFTPGHAGQGMHTAPRHTAPMHAPPYAHAPLCTRPLMHTENNLFNTLSI